LAIWRTFDPPGSPWLEDQAALVVLANDRSWDFSEGVSDPH
jgi:hypothetical protein